MIQFNLLPDIKQQYIKAQRTKRLIISVSILIAIASLALVILLALGVFVVQKKQISDANNNIGRYNAEIQNIPNINRMLTVQNQLNSLPALHDQKPAATRLFDYLKQVTPARADITNLTVDFTQDTLNITGTADALSTVNQYVDTLKFTKYKSDDAGSTAQPAFSNVVLSSFGKSQGKASYTIDLGYNPDIFDITKNITLTVPNTTTTRSQLDNPSDLFTQSNSGTGAQ